MNHGILLNKLEHYGVRGTAKKWFESYLTKRMQCVSFNKITSDFHEASCGVPQGSILGPILFLLYINDLNNVTEKFGTIMFADDTNLFMTGDNIAGIEKQCNEELQKLTQWFHSNLLSLKVKKTTFMIFSKKKNLHANQFIENVQILKTNDTKILGVILSSNLSWRCHTDMVLNKISKNIGIISKVRHLIPVHLSRSLYLTLVEPYINICNIIWAGSSNSGSLDRILRVQKKYCRLITFSGFTAHSRPLFEELFILTVYGIYKYQLSIFMYKLLNNLMPDHIVKRFVFYENSQIHTYATRHSSALHSEFCRTLCRQSSVRMQGRKLWNALPLDIKKLSLIVFKKALKRCIIFNQID